MKLALHYANFSYPGGPQVIAANLAATARAADEGGFSTMTLMDHYFQIDSVGQPEDPMLEGYSALGFVAGQTRHLTLGLLVTGVTYRYPGLLAKIVTTLDVLSVDGPCSGLERPGTTASITLSGCRTPRSPSGSSGWRRRSRS